MDVPNAKLALQLGWEKPALLEAAQYIASNKLKVSRLTQDFILLSNRWLVYRGVGLSGLTHYMECLVSGGPVVVWGDGSGTSSDKPAGIGCVVECPCGRITEVSENIGLGTNNKAELMAIWRGLQEVPDTKREILVHSDSEWAMGALTKDWKIQKNASLVDRIKSDLRHRMNVRFEHVKGHSGIKQNERCDKLAKQGRVKEIL